MDYNNVGLVSDLSNIAKILYDRGVNNPEMFNDYIDNNGEKEMFDIMEKILIQINKEEY